MIRSFKLSCGLIAGLGVATTPLHAKINPQIDKKQNVLLLVVDDWGVRDQSYSGSEFYETQNIDKLANQSIVFNQAYVAYPRSVPSRYSLFTGMHCARPQSNDVKEKDERKVLADSYCLAEPFKDAGYQTFFIGKWHLSSDDCLPEDKGFDINIGGGHAGAPASYFYPFNVRKNKQHKTEANIANMDDAYENEYLTDYMARKTVDYINQDHNEPFFAVCSFYAVHTPLEAKPELVAKYRNKKKEMQLPADSFIEEEAGVRKNEQNHPVYAAMIESVDQAVGQIVDALKANGLYENTLIVLISDHGGLSNRGAKNKRELATTNASFKAGKGHLYEGGVRVPLLIHLPKQVEQRIESTPVASYDLFPTLTQLSGITPDYSKLDGLSLAKLITDGKDKATAQRSLYWHKASERPSSTGDYVSSAVRSGKYKLIDFYKQGRVELYDLENDPQEQNNLVDKEPKVAKKLMGQLNKWRSEYKVIYPNDSMSKDKKKAQQEKRKNKKQIKNIK